MQREDSMSLQSRRIRQFAYFAVLAIGVAVSQSPTRGANPPGTPSVEQALKLTPIQKDVEYDRPSPDEAAKCTIKAEKIGNQTGWVVRDGSGTILREFVDSNGDNIVDRWSYYQDGVEVYRDIDSDFNGKADSYRWLNTAGIRWGLDKNEDGVIDSWKAISAEEVSSEIVAAIRTKDQKRFERLLLTPAELKTLGLSDEKSKSVSDKLAKANAAFTELLKSQKHITPKTNWVHFAATSPGVVPAGTAGSTADLTVYENTLAMVETEGKHSQLIVGTLIKVGEVWRAIDAPQIAGDGNPELASRGFFFVSNTKRPEKMDNVPGAPTDATQKAMADLEKFDVQIGKTANAKERAELNDKRAELLEQIVEEASDKDKASWVRQLADSVSAAVQSGEYPAGIERMKKFQEKLAKTSEDQDVLSYLKFRTMTAEYAQAVQAPGADFGKIQEGWLAGLEKFVADYPKGSDTAEALLQLGVAQEFAGQEEKAKSWYNQITANFPGTPHAKRASGSITRIDSVGKGITLRGKTYDGKSFDLSQLRGKTVLVQYWATWCEPAKADMAQLKELQVKYAKEGFAVVGVSLDTEAKTLNDFLARNKLPWPVLFESGGLDSRYAYELGIHTLPTMVLLDAKGNVLNRNVHISELDNDLRAQFK